MTKARVAHSHEEPTLGHLATRLRIQATLGECRRWSQNPIKWAESDRRFNREDRRRDVVNIFFAQACLYLIRKQRP